MSVQVAATQTTAVRPAARARRRLNPLIGYGLAAGLSACIWAMLLAAIF